MFIIARSQKLQGKGSNSVVGTKMSNLGLEHALKDHDMVLHRSQVGDRYVIEMLKEKGGVVGGDSSGHIICLDKTTTGDGIVAALQVLCEISRSGSTLHELQSLMTKIPQTLVNVRVNKVTNLAEDEAVLAIVTTVEKRLGSKGRVLLRASGTEPVIRVMVEGPDLALTKSLANEIASVIKTRAKDA